MTAQRAAAPERGLIGVVHLPALPGDPLAGPGSSFDDAERRAIDDAEALVKGGVDGLIVENFGSVPFSKGTEGHRAPPHQVAALALVARALVLRFGKPVGINCLRNDAPAALGAAAAAGASFVRVNVHVGAMVTDQGLIEGEAAHTLRYREALSARGVAIWADVLVKHASPLAPLDARQAARDCLERGLADALVVSGAGTGEPVDLGRLREIAEAAGPAPVWLGSGLSPSNADALAPLARGAVVGTWVKRGGDVRAPVDLERVRELVAAVKGKFRPVPLLTGCLGSFFAKHTQTPKPYLTNLPMHTRHASAPEGPPEGAPPLGRGASTPPPRPSPKAALRALARLAPFALLALACAEPNDGPEGPTGRAEQAIEGGADESGFLEVVQLIYTQAGGQGVRCTGVVIAPDLVLTARHCVANFYEPIRDCSGGRQQGESSALAVRFRVPGKDDYPVFVPPGMVRVPSSDCNVDVALVRVPSMLDLRNEPWFKAASPRLDRALEPGESYTALGFGDANAQGEGGDVLRQRPSLLVSCLGENCEAGAGANSHEWQGEAGVCKGDSGGPAFDSQGRVVGIASRSNTADCRDPIYTSVFSWRTWLKEEALIAARASSYPDPPWAHRVADENEGDGGTLPFVGGGKCSFGPSPKGQGALALSALGLGLVALGARRRARRGD